MDWMDKAALVAMELKPGLDLSHALDIADDLQRTCEAGMGPSEAVYRFFSAMPPGWRAIPVPVWPH